MTFKEQKRDSQKFHSGKGIASLAGIAPQVIKIEGYLVIGGQL
jgi:hypothetical protein